MKNLKQKNMGCAHIPYVSPKTGIVQINALGVILTSGEPVSSTQQYEVEEDNNPWNSWE